MPNLLQKASIVLTPTAYNDGEVLCAKPSKPPYGDFDFSRNSAATRVNAQGLVENVQILSSNLVQNGNFSEEGVQEISNGSFSQEGAELITNGDFTNGTTGWSSNATLTESNNIANITTTSTATVYIRQNNVYEFGKRYKLTFTAKVDNLTEFELYVGSTNAYISTGIIPTQTTDFQEYNFYFQADTAGGMNLLLRQSMVANSSIEYSEISVREVGQDWNLGTGWSIGEDKAISDTTASNLTPSTVLVSGKTYKFTLDVAKISAGSFTFLLRFNGSNTVIGTINSEGSFTFYAKADATGFRLQNLSGGTTDFSVTNISVKEVGMDWTLGTGWSIGENKAISDATQGYITQTDLSGAGVTATYKVQWTQNITTGTRLRFFARNYNDSGNATTLSITRDDGTSMGGGNCVGSGTFTAYVSSTNGYSFKIVAETGVEADITNITTIQITDDTNLPRINYEGFSYQDALGSELVVNGDFATDSNWFKDANWSIANGVATSTGYGRMFQSIPFLEANVGTKVKVSFDITENTNGGVVVNCYGIVSQLFTSVGTHTFTATTINNTNLYFNNVGAGGSFNGSIDNVSVKEYLGQEVVPNSGCGSWLFEPQSTNLITQSELFSDASWANVGLTINNNASVSPEGVFNATKIIATTANSRHELKTNLATANGTDMVSCFVKKSGYNYVQIASWANPSNYVNFDLANGSVGSIGTTPPTNYGIKDYGNGWYRIYANVQASGGGIVGIGIVTSASSGWAQSFIGNGIDGIEIWGAQVEQQSYATSYIPTSGSQVTRNQDVCTNGGSLATINSTEGVLYAEIAALANDGTARMINISDGTLDNRVEISLSNQDNFIRVVSIVNGIYNAAKLDISANVTDFNKIAFSYKENDFKAYLNGTNVFTDTSAIIFAANTLDTIKFGAPSTNSFNFFGKTKCVAVWKEALSDQELADLTYPTPTDPTFTLDFDTIAEQFTFARGSEATYVDAQGLIQSTNEIGEELVVNGDFSNGSTGWNVAGGNPIFENSSVNFVNFSTINSNNTVVELGKTYKITYTISNKVGNSSFGFFLGGWNVAQYQDVGTHSEIISVSSSSVIYIRNGNSNSSVTIDNVSVKEYTTATNTPRLDYSTGAEAFLLEPQSTNLITYSNDWSFANFNNSSVLLNTDISPDGTQNADTITFNGAFSAVRKNYTYTAGTTYTISFYAKKLVGNGIFEMYDNTNSQTISSFNITDEWARYSGTFTPSNTSTLVYWLRQGGSGIYQTILLWGAQVEALSYPTSYIPSNGSQTTRNQETCINATPEINSEEGVLYFEASRLSDLGASQIGLFGSSVNEQLRIEFNNSSIRAQLYNGSYQVNMTSSQTVTNNNKIAFKYKENDFALWINGVEVLTDNSGVTFNADELIKFNLSGADGSANPFFGNTKDVQVYTKALSDAELIKLTT